MKVENKIRCLECNTILESKHRHDFRICECPNQAFVDGGLVYQRVGALDLTKLEIWNGSKWIKLTLPSETKRLKSRYRWVPNALKRVVEAYKSVGKYILRFKLWIYSLY